MKFHYLCEMQEKKSEETSSGRSIRIGILTRGKARMAGHTVLNALMGNGFHWSRVYPLLLPPESMVVSSDPLVVEMPVEAYLRSVVASEMNPNAPIEFLRAHAIVSRSWVMGKILRLHAEGTDGQILTPDEICTWADTASHNFFDVCNDDHCQRFQGQQPLADTLRHALESTAGMVLADSLGNVIDARFSKCCGGRTELFSTCWQNVDYQYLPSIPDPWCNPAHMAPGFLSTVLKDYDISTTPDYYEWEERVEAEEIRERLQSRFGRDVGSILSLEAEERGPSGRIKSLRITGSSGELVLGKELAVRRLLSRTHLYSSAFTIERSAQQFILHGRGWGHGVGLCQIGAAAMAQAGKTADEILSFYYPGSRIMFI